MNIHINSLKAKIQDKYVIGLLVAVAIISFFLGMEYKAYQFRSAIKDAFSGMQDAFKNPGSIEKEKSENVTKKEEEKPNIEVLKGGSHTYENGVKLSIDSVKNAGKEIKQDYMKYTAKNNFYEVIIAGENTGKSPEFKSLSSTKLILADGTTYNSTDTIQLGGEKEGFGGCVQCTMNPADKSIEAILFDINVPSIDGAKLVIDDISFNL